MQIALIDSQPTEQTLRRAVVLLFLCSYERSCWTLLCVWLSSVQFILWPLECHKKLEILLASLDKELQSHWTCEHSGQWSYFFSASLTSDQQQECWEIMWKLCGKERSSAWKWKHKDQKKRCLTWQMLDVGGQQLGFLLLIALLRDVT